MKALTLIQPWAYAIERLGKRVENRTWKPPAAIIGQRIAIHAGKTLDQNAVRHLEHAGHVVDRTIVLGAITCTAIVRGWVEVDAFRSRACPAEVVWATRSAWFNGPIGWVLEDVASLSSDVPCRGAQGLWTVPADVAAQVLALHREQP